MPITIRMVPKCSSVNPARSSPTIGARTSSSAGSDSKTDDGVLALVSLSFSSSANAGAIHARRQIAVAARCDVREENQPWSLTEQQQMLCMGLMFILTSYPQTNATTASHALERTSPGRWRVCVWRVDRRNIKSVCQRKRSIPLPRSA